MSKNNFSSKVRIALFKGMEAIGTSASNLASNAKLKVNEINLETRRREILTDFSLQAFDLWQNGTQLPEPLDALFQELSEIEARLSVLRAQKYGKVAAENAAQDQAASPDPPADEVKEPVECSVETDESEPQEPVQCSLQTDGPDTAEPGDSVTEAQPAETETPAEPAAESDEAAPSEAAETQAAEAAPTADESEPRG
ncbi:MAG TPA: hypothetical protein PLP25_02315 [Candidatus Limiplasma sp.]|mgnify:CR=1 FL=1|nr:hypothetical protein [Candidatus Limiplasma sp.]HPS80680.1 hypothetical protein [Candidatus Limiplasma sp.]